MSPAEDFKFSPIQASDAGEAAASSESDLSFGELSFLNNGLNTISIANHPTANTPTTTVAVCFLPEGFSNFGKWTSDDFSIAAAASSSSSSSDWFYYLQKLTIKRKRIKQHKFFQKYQVSRLRPLMAHSTIRIWRV